MRRLIKIIAQLSQIQLSLLRKMRHVGFVEFVQQQHIFGFAESQCVCKVFVVIERAACDISDYAPKRKLPFKRFKNDGFLNSCKDKIFGTL